MKKLKIPLHIQIILGLIIGTIFGVLFSVDTHTIEIVYQNHGKNIHKEITKWDEISFYELNEELAKYDKDDQIAIIKFFKKNNKKNLVLNVMKDDNYDLYENIKDIKNKLHKFQSSNFSTNILVVYCLIPSDL